MLCAPLGYTTHSRHSGSWWRLRTKAAAVATAERRLRCEAVRHVIRERPRRAAHREEVVS